MAATVFLVLAKRVSRASVSISSPSQGLMADDQNGSIRPIRGICPYYKGLEICTLCSSLQTREIALWPGQAPSSLWCCPHSINISWNHSTLTNRAWKQMGSFTPESHELKLHPVLMALICKHLWDIHGSQLRNEFCENMVAVKSNDSNCTLVTFRIGWVGCNRQNCYELGFCRNWNCWTAFLWMKIRCNSQINFSMNIKVIFLKLLICI